MAYEWRWIVRFVVGLSIVALAALPVRAQRGPVRPGSPVPVGTGHPVRPDSANGGKADEPYVVKTLALHHLSNADAVKLLMPYSKYGQVFEVGPSIHAVTVRAPTSSIAEMERLLAEYDRSPITLTLSFQLIGADETNTRDASLVGLDSLLRGVLKFSGYKLLSTAVANVGERSYATQRLAGDQEDYQLTVELTDVRTEGAEASAHLKVTLATLSRTASALFETGVTVPMGNTVVLGTAASHGTEKALILTVRRRSLRRRRGRPKRRTRVILRKRERSEPRPRDRCPADT